jgi:hypothetical protein
LIPGVWPIRGKGENVCSHPIPDLQGGIQLL